MQHELVLLFIFLINLMMYIEKTKQLYLPVSKCLGKKTHKESKFSPFQIFVHFYPPFYAQKRHPAIRKHSIE